MSRYKEAISTSKWPKFALSRLQYHLDNSCNSSESTVKFGSHVRLISDQRRLFWGKYVVSYTFIYPLDLRVKPEPESSTWQNLTRNQGLPVGAAQCFPVDYQRKHVLHFWPWQILATSPYTRELKQQQRRRLRKRQIIKKWIHAASNFIALILSRSIRQMLVIFLELNSLRLYRSSGKEKASHCRAVHVLHKTWN